MPTPRHPGLAAENAALRNKVADLERRLAAEERASALRAHHARQLDAARSLSQEVVTELDLQVLLSLIVRRITELVEGGNGTIWLWDEASNSLTLQTPITHEDPGKRLPIGHGAVGVVAERREGLIINDYRKWPHARQDIVARTRVTAVVAEPLLYRDRLIGVLSIDNEQTGRLFGPEDQKVLRLFAPQAAIAIENARLHEEPVRRGEELAALLRTTRAVMGEHSLDATLHRIVEEAAQISGTIHVKVMLLDPESRTLRVAAAQGTTVPDNFVVPVGSPFSGLVAETGTSLFVPDLLADPRNPLTERDRAEGLHTLLCLPIAIREEVLGVLTFNTTEPREYSRAELAYLELFADQAAIAIENARLFQREQQRRTQLEALQMVSQEVTRELDASRLLALVSGRVLELLGGSSGAIWLWDEPAGVLRTAIWHGFGEWMRGRTLRLGEGVPGTVAATRRGMIVNDYRVSPHAHPLALVNTDATAVVAEPLLYRDRLVGVITVNNSAATERRFASEDQDILRLFAAQAAIAIENARLFEELRQSLIRLEQTHEEMVRSEKLRALGQMSAGIAHDLNNILATILGQTELLRIRTPDPTLRESLLTLETAATDGAHVVRRLQDFARQRGHASLAPVDLAAIVAEVVEITRPRWQDEAVRRGASIQVEMALDVRLPVLGYAPEIRQALANLVFNAVDAMPNGGTLRFASRLVDVPRRPSAPDEGNPGERTGGSPAQPTACVELAVSDTGIGMPEDVRRRAFDPFFTTKGIGGTGLGLSAVYGIMERHGGRIEVESAPGRGTTFILQFQRAAAVEAPSEVPPARGAAACRLLVIDDEDSVRQTLTQLLLAAGHQVLDAPSGAAGLALLDRSPVECVLTDLGMPEMVGWEVARRVKARTPDLPVVLLTGWGEQVAGTVEAENASVVDRIVGKPVHLEELLAVIRELTERRQEPGVPV